MDIRKVSDSVAIYSDGKRLQVIHNLGDEFILDFEIKNYKTINIDDLSPRIVSEITPIFKVSGYCSRRGEDTQRLKWAILWMFLGYLLGERSAREDKTDDQ